MNRSLRVALPAAAFASLLGCAAQPTPFDSKAYAGALKENGVSVLVYSERPLFIHTPGSAVGTGLIDELTKPDGTVVDLPSVSRLVAQSLRDSLISQSGLDVAPLPDKLLPAKDADQPGLPAGQGKRFVLKLSIPINGLYYRPTAWSTYQYMMQARGTLIDSSDGKILWQDLCKVGGVSEDTSLQLERTEFKANDGAKLKNIMRQSTRRCANELASKLRVTG